ncbi:unnamed protein product [Spirodela intermedia]|uniref:Uncharacterized protein n=1 Tax=Spirodela intermedia TaxID=51605 RepID=A0A7I8IGV0_SPIIN|nr:unnamed protein product [Spirodela intermedia]CAA6657121.1 unnamed protein product [Spirodela intermedia]
MKGSSRWTNKRRARAKRRKTHVSNRAEQKPTRTEPNRNLIRTDPNPVRAFHAAPENGVGVSTACTVTPVEQGVHCPVQSGPSYMFSWLASAGEVYSCRIPGFVSHEIIPSRP